MKKIVLLFAVLCGLVSCGSGESRLIGSWIQSVPGMEGAIQGIRIEKGGKASSINMHTLVYEHWKKDGDRLLLTGKSIGNGQTLSFTDTMQIKKLTATSLVLERGTYTAEYTRSGEPDNAETVSAADSHTAENSLDYLGTYKGTFPAADCPGIHVTLTLEKDGKYAQKYVYIDRPEGTFEQTGTYTVSGNLLTLQSGNDAPEYFRIEEKRLRRLDMNKQEITGSLAEHYILKKD